MSLARNTLKTVPPDKRRRVGGPRQANQDDLSESGSQDQGYGSASEELLDDDRDPSAETQDPAAEAATSSSTASAPAKEQRKSTTMAAQAHPRAGRQREVQSD